MKAKSVDALAARCCGDKGNKAVAVSLVERGGRVRSSIVNKVIGDESGELLRLHAAPSAQLNTMSRRSTPSSARDSPCTTWLTTERRDGLRRPGDQRGRHQILAERRRLPPMNTKQRIV
jgi:hypothetical protein